MKSKNNHETTEEKEKHEKRPQPPVRAFVFFRASVILMELRG
jgi:hypothetical protein